MTELNNLLSIVVKSPGLLGDLIGSIPQDLLKKRRSKNKWSIHEHACHLVHAEEMILERFRIFKIEQSPSFKPYLPGKTVKTNDFHSLQLPAQLTKFVLLRAETIALLKTYHSDDWSKPSYHPEYTEYISAQKLEAEIQKAL